MEDNSQAISSQNKRPRRPCRSKSCVRARKRRLRAWESTLPTIARPVGTRSVFERYLSVQQLIADEEQYHFLEALKRPLPLCFRIRTPQVLQDWDKIRREQRIFAKAIPNMQRSWHMLPHESPTVRSWLSSRTAAGLISRQEFVSMIPVHLLQITGSHAVLDLCASPGSKTIQAVDDLYAVSEDPTGFVIANELDPRRAYVLAHRCRATLSLRLKSVAITCHNACKFPNIEAPLFRNLSPGNPSSTRPFDRIICDVPCSGDGTLRKDFKVWKTWHPEYGISLHALQVRIAKRGIALLKIGGLITYSTCSFHPIENEAVVAALLRTGCVELIAADDLLSGMRYRPGLIHWKVIDDNCEEKSPNSRSDWPSTLWPPKDRQITRELPKCVRMVPQDNDTGGFFIALLRKIKEFPTPSTPCCRSRPKMVTPQATHHKLFPISQHETKDRNHRVFLRSPTGKRQFHLSPSLASALTERPGSSKLNIVYTGYCIDPGKDHTH